VHLRRKDDLEGHRFPCRLMLRQDYRRPIRQVLASLDAPIDAEQRACQPDVEARPARDDAIAPHARQRKGGERKERIGRGDEDLREHKEARAEPRHGARCSANAARSAKTCVPGGRLPSACVFCPLPVRTSTGRAPAAAAACTSRSPSPTMYVSFSAMLKRRATSSSMPGWGLRHWQAASAAGGQKKNASMRPP